MIALPQGDTTTAATNAVFGEPPASFRFLLDIFQRPPDPASVPAARPQRVSFVNDLDVKATVYHQMNADMVVATGSSFPLVAVTMSPKVSDWFVCFDKGGGGEDGRGQRFFVSSLHIHRISTLS